MIGGTQVVFGEKVKVGEFVAKVDVFLIKYIQVGFFDWSALKMTKCQTLNKF